MKKVITTLVAAGALTLSAQAQDSLFAPFIGNYVDVLVSTHYDSSLTPYAQVGANTFSSATAPEFLSQIGGYYNDSAAITNGGWRLRSYNGPYSAGGGAQYAMNSNIYFIQDQATGEPAGYTKLTGMTPNTVYTLAVWGVVGPGETNPKDALQFSWDNGATWGTVYDATEVSDPLGGGDWLLHDSAFVDGGIGTDTGALLKDASADGGGDRRFRIIIGDFTSDGSGNFTIGFRDPGYATKIDGSLNGNDRGRIDGFAFAEGDINTVPEPTTFALAGLGAAALLIFRRRS
jgi:hypothetical protein